MKKYNLPFNISGAIQYGEPTTVYRFLKVGLPVTELFRDVGVSSLFATREFSCMTLARPKSATIALLLP